MKTLSLGEWPKTFRRQNNSELTPITKRILSQVHLQPDQLLPISFEKFLHLHTPDEESVFNQKDYQDQLERRRKQVKILADIRNNYIMGKDYGPFVPKIPIQLKTQIKKSRVGSKCSALYLKSLETNQSCHLQAELSRVKSQRSAKSKELGICSRVKSRERTYRKQDNQLQYPIHSENANKNNKKSSHQTHQKLNFKRGKAQLREQAGRSKVSSIAKEQYGYSQMNQKGKTHQLKQSSIHENRNQRIGSSKFLYHELLRAVQKWNKLDDKQANEIEKLQGSGTKEKERLRKIHSIEKAQMLNCMKLMKKRLNSETRSVQFTDTQFF